MNGAVVLDETEGLVEGARVTVLIDEPDDAPVSVDQDELDAIDRCLAEAAAGRVLDAREFLAELRRQG